jgi:hypothetical protein
MALQLLPNVELLEDPVLNVFCGLPPRADVMDQNVELPCSPAEAADIAILTTRLVDLLRVRLQEPTISAELMIDRVCRKQVDIEFDPGWIEVKFKLDEVSTSIRRAGLDRDLGWLPWLGTVVKFAYV